MNIKHQVFAVWFIIFILWSFYRAYFRLPELTDEFLVKPLIFVLPVLYVVCVREKKSLKELGLAPKLRDLFTDLYIGVVIGIIFAFEGLLINSLK